MAVRRASLIFLVGTIISAYGNVVNQPKIYSNEVGTLFLEAVPDKNITIRLTHGASLYVNDFDVLNEMEKCLAAEELEKRTEPITIDKLQERVQNLKRIIGRLIRRSRRLLSFNRGSAQARIRIITRDLGRIERVAQNLMNMETNLAIDECRTDPCKNGGTCYDGYLAFQCECAAGWQGPTCEDDVNECFVLAGTDLAGCHNNGQCINTPGSYRCVCRNGYTGAHCRLRKAVCLQAQSAELCGHGICVPTNNEQGYSCICDQGWTKANVTAACILDVNECEPTHNPCYAECINLPGRFKCGTCPIGYTGDGRHCQDVNECANNNGGCSLQPKVRCINTEGSYHCGRCPLGWTGDGRSCVQKRSNSCNAEQICHPSANCEFISETVVCTCPVGMFGHGFGANGCTLDVTFDPCERHVCEHNGTCVRNGRGTSCICQKGYMGPLCNQTDACFSNPCQNNGDCLLLPNNVYKCRCTRGFSGLNCELLRSYCGTNLRRESGALSFPPNDVTYEPEERCALIISTGIDKILNLTFNAFDLEQSTDCSKDFLQMHDGSSLAAQLIGRFCGQSLPRGNGNIITSQHSIFLWFRSDNATQGRGFNISWHSQPHICGEDLTLSAGQTGIIRSPGYPGKSAPLRNCEWLLEVPYGYRVLLHFYELTLGNDNDECLKDTLIISDSDRLLLKACRSLEPAPIHSSSNELSIHFHTDGYRSDSAFQLHYEVVTGTPGCGGHYTEPSAIISGYINAPVCLYLIEQIKGTQIKLDFTKMDLLNGLQCQLQKVEIFDGRTPNAPLLKRYCGQPSEFESIVSTDNTLLLRYEYALSGLELRKHYEFKYRRVCNMDLVAESGVVTTPNYPNAYAEYLLCTFNIRAPIRSIIKISITDLSFSDTVPNMTDSDYISVSTNDENTNYLDIYLSKEEKIRYYKSTTDTINLISRLNHAQLLFHGAANRARQRGLRFEYTFEPINCGGVLRENEEVLQYISNYCEYIIEAPRGTRVKLKAKLDVRNPVVENNLTVYDNSTAGNGRLLDSFYNNFGPKEFLYESNLLTIIWRQNSGTKNPAMFSLSYETQNASEFCGGVFSYSYGYIRSPNYPKPYGDSQHCIWLLKAPMGHKIELNIKNFTLEYSSPCMDYLEIRNGDTALSPLIGRYCGTTIPSRIPSFGNRLYLVFRSDSLKTESGFDITWQRTQTGCGGKLTTHTGSIHSPHNNIDGENDAVTCDWQIVVAQGSTITLQLSIQGTDCAYKQLSIFDGSTSESGHQLQYNCTSQMQTLQSTSNQVLVRYNNDEEASSVKFVLNYETNCNVVHVKLQGIIESPNFPEYYPANLDCSWDIRAGGRNNHISLIFSHLSVEQTISLNCNYDYIVVNDMKDDELLGEQHLCTTRVDPITSVGNRLLMRFVSDGSQHAYGFRAEYKRLGCGEHLYDAYRNLASPNAPYSVDMDCDWYIEAPFGKQIKLELQELHIETEQHDCSNDFLLIAEQMNSTVGLLRTCQIAETPQSLISPGNRLYVHYRASNTRARKYFKANYYFIDAKCGGQQISSAGLITTPDFYANIYATNMECDWQLEVPIGYGMNLHFESFNLTESKNCQEAFVELVKLDKSQEIFLERACGGQQPLIRQLHGQKLNVRFKASANAWGRFALRWEQQCGGNLYTSNGLIKSRFDESCTWLLSSSEEGTKINLNILHFECQPCALNISCTNGLKLFNNNDDVLLNDICLSHKSNLLMPTNSLRIEAAKVNFRASYSFTQNSCGGIITSLSGTLTSPNYPDVYPANVECVWQLKATKGNAYILTFEALDIAESMNCNEDFLEIHAAGVQGKLLGLYCGNEMPDIPLYAGDNVWLKFRSVSANIANGFKLNWDYAHECEFNASSGTIMAPPVLAAGARQEPYSWRIILKRGQLVQLNFKEYNGGLQLYDGYDDMVLPIEINYSPWSFISSTNVIFIKSINNDLDNFRITWSSLDAENVTKSVNNSDCQTLKILSWSAKEIISSPGYPNGYAPNLNCAWTLKPRDPTQHVVVELYEVKMENEMQCQRDFLLFSTSNNLVDWHEVLRICSTRDANRIPIKVIEGTPNVKMELITDDSINGTGFKSLVRTTCGSNMTDNVGQILDSHILRSHSINFTCTWHVEVHPGKQIDIIIDYNKESLKSHESCPHYGLIYDGLDEQANILSPGKFCNQEGFKTRSYRSSSNHIVIKYFVPTYFGNPQQNLWNLTYREFAACDGNFRLTPYANSLNISTPGYPNVPKPYTTCDWIVVGPVGETLTIHFNDKFDMNQRYCDKEFVELYDGSTYLSRRLLHTCNKPLKTLRTSSNILLVRYQTAIAEPRSGFKLNVSISNCGGIYSETQGFVTSEHYPTLGAYPKPSVCDYVIKLPKNSLIRLNFMDINLPYDPANSTNNDRIELINLDTMTAIKVFYGNISNVPNIELDEHELLVRFTSVKSTRNYRGFRLQYLRFYSMCYRDVSGTSGTLSVSVRERTSLYTTCRWRIRVPKGQRVRLTFLNLQLANATQFATPTRGLRINQRFVFYNDDQLMSKITEFNLSNFNSSEIIQSTDNFMLAKFTFGQQWNTVGTIRAAYTAIDDSPCPPDISDSSSGYIDLTTLANYETFYCSIGFKLQEPETISFNISELSLTSKFQASPLIFFNEELHIPTIFIRQNMTNHLVSVSSKAGRIILMQNEKAKLLRFQAIYRRHACGGIYILEEGLTISYPKFAQTNYGSVECVWTLKTTVGDTTYALMGNVSFKDSCEREYLLIFEGIRAYAGIPLKICQDAPQVNQTFLEKTLTTIIYHASDYQGPQSDFNLMATKSLNNVVMNVGNKPTAPIVIDAKHYKNNMELSWEFLTNEGMYLSLIFKDRFFIEDSVNCTNDQLELQHFQQGFWYKDALFCGRTAPTNFNITSNRMRIIFRTNANITGDGFTFFVISTCYLRLNVTTELQKLNSPKFVAGRIGKNYCNYIFETTTEQLIRVSVRHTSNFLHPVYSHFLPTSNNHIVRASNRNCELTNFKAYKMSDSQQEIYIDKYCGDLDAYGKHRLRLSYESLYERNFIIEYQLNTCGGNYSEEFVLQSLVSDENNNYMANMNCVWHINAPPDHAIIIRFKYFEMEVNSECMYDYLAIYKGAMQNKEQRISHICGNLTNKLPQIVIDNNQAVIAAISDSSTQFKGFLANVHFTPNCNERITLSEGNEQVTLQRYYKVNASEELLCYYRITAPPGYRLSAQIKNLQLGACSTIASKDCAENCNYLELIDSLNADGVTIGKYCTAGRNQTQLVSSYADMLVKLNAPKAGNISIELSLRMERTICGVQQYTLKQNEEVTIALPVANQTSYPPNTHCTWVFNRIDDIEINFKRVQLPDSSELTGKCVDYLYVKSLYFKKFFCGIFNETQILVPFFSTSELTVTFHSDNVIEEIGNFEFIIRYKKFCNSTYTQLSNLISYNKLESLGNCTFDIQVPETYQISLYISNIYFIPPETNISFIRITDLTQLNRTIFNRTENFYRQDNLHTTTNALRVTSMNIALLKIFYIAVNKSLPSGCGGDVFATEGEFTNPNYGNRNYSECSWDISVPAGNKINVHFNYFSMGSEINCQLDNLKIYEVRSNAKRLVNTLCGEANPAMLTINSSRMIIVAKKSPNFNGEGFSVYFSMEDSYENWFNPKPVHELV